MTLTAVSSGHAPTRWFAHVTCAGQEGFSALSSPTCATITTVHLRMFSLPPEETQHSSATTHPAPTSHSPGNHESTSCPGIIGYVAFGVRLPPLGVMSSRFTHAVACVRTSFPFMVEPHSIVWTHILFIFCGFCFETGAVLSLRSPTLAWR